MTDLLSVRGLRVSYRTGRHTVPAVAGVDLTVRRGEVVAVVGESGSGKSTLAHAVIGLLPEHARTEAGTVLFAGTDLLTGTDRHLRAVRGRGIGFIPQDPVGSLNPVLPVGAQVAEVLHIHRRATSRRDALDQAVDLLDRAGLPDPRRCARQYPHQLSGGMCQRVLIAIALAGRPQLLIADEPTSALDVTVQRQILDHLEVLARDTGTAVLLITHDLAVAADRAQQIVVLSQGRVVERGPARALLAGPAHPYTRRLVADAPRLTDHRLESGAARPAAGTPLLSVRGLRKVYRGTPAVDGIDFDVARGETLALVGESGSGKSTTARLLVGLDPPTAGAVRFDGADVAALDRAGRRDLHRRIQIVEQNPYAAMDPRFTVRQVVEEPLRAFRTGDRVARQARVAELLDQVALAASVAARRPAELSGGQRQRVALARALALGPQLLICDEPVSALDVTVQAQILRLLARLQAELGLSMLFITHDLAVVRRIADRVAVMWAGRLVETGAADDVLTGPGHPYTRSLLAAVPGVDRAEEAPVPGADRAEEAPVPGVDRAEAVLNGGVSGVDGQAHHGRSDTRSR
ncbi:dipeptide ABC transporter ATP-binding protein [Dactylosporangium siamense]|uniref:Peptide ABC transporter ATP-binding protein n=1 Tax=Dactylosporangium siamense TaxID=685454 RepID=A0A919PFV7_9ACTN|nr:ABC transporter ATP-binding protein [Dactylosporangium siamense]GIG42617.1 peptide ABC transporter ATP-binding protein [Dactylosporangium siamense]